MGVGGGRSASSSWKTGHGCLGTEGCRSTGATMSVAPRRGAAASNCCINIYVNNNVQGVTNSVLVGSKVAMRDPGARVWSGHPSSRGCGCQGKKDLWAAAAAMVCLALMILLLCVWICVRN